MIPKHGFITTKVMDWGYIFLNTLTYGVLAIALSGFFAYSKFLNLSIGSGLVALAYILSDIFSQGIRLHTFVLFLTLIVLYYVSTWVLWHLFPNNRQRDHAGLIITLALGGLLENLINYLYGPSSVSLAVFTFPRWGIRLTILLLMIFFYYLFTRSIVGIVFRGLFEQSSVIRSIGIRSMGLLQSYYTFIFFLLAGVAFIILNESSIRSSDNFFYLIKGLGIMILVGVNKKEYMIIGAFLYVLLEYLMFVAWGLPLSYKESLVLLVILFVLIFKPEGLFSIGKRAL